MHGCGLLERSVNKGRARVGPLPVPIVKGEALLIRRWLVGFARLFFGVSEKVECLLLAGWTEKLRPASDALDPAAVPPPLKEEPSLFASSRSGELLVSLTTWSTPAASSARPLRLLSSKCDAARLTRTGLSPVSMTATVTPSAKMSADQLRLRSEKHSGDM